MSVRRRQLPFARRATAALLVGFWLFATVGSIFHGSNDQHRYCSQHKVFEEVGARGAGVAQATPADSSERGWKAGAAEETIDHQACAFADLGVRAPLDQPTTLHVALPAPPALAPAPILVHIAPPIPLLANAPKASPPLPVV
jgi:hypothetical protein